MKLKKPSYQSLKSHSGPGAMKLYIWFIIGTSISLFLINRHIVRPFYLEKIEFVPLIIIINSLPNFIEAILGTLLLVGNGLTIRSRIFGKKVKMNDFRFYLICTIIAALFVLSQECNLINLSENKVYDPNDVIASLLGLIGMNLLLNRFGFINVVDKEIQND